MVWSLPTFGTKLPIKLQYFCQTHGTNQVENLYVTVENNLMWQNYVQNSYKKLKLNPK